MAFREYFEMFMNLLLDNFNVFNDLNMHLDKLWLCFDNCKKFNISLNPNKCMFLFTKGVIPGYVVSMVGKLYNPKTI